MAGTKIRGITIELDGDSSGLSKALKDINKDLKDTNSQLKDVDKLLKLDPKNTELLAQKQKLLKEAIEQSNTKLSELKDMEAQLKNQGVDENSDQFMALKREIAETEANIKKLTTEAKNTKTAFNGIKEAADKVAASADKVAQKTKALSAAGAAVAGGMAALGLSSISTADDLATLSTRTGISTDTLQKFAYAQDMVDVSTEELAGALAKMKKNIMEHPERFEELGIAVMDAEGNYRDLESVFYDTLSVLGQVDGEMERDMASMELFGKSGDTLATIIDDGGEALKAYGEKAQEMGLILSEDTIGKLTATKDTIDEMKARAKAAMAEVGAKLVEELAPNIQKIIDKIGEVVEWIGTLDGDTLNMIMTVGLVIAAISPLASIIGGVTKAISAVSSALSFLVANPIVALIAAIVGLVVLIATKGEEIKAVLEKVDNFLQNIFVKDWSNQFGVLGHIMNVFFSVFAGIWETIKGVFTGIIDFIRGVFTGDWERAFNGLGNIVSAAFAGIKRVLDGITSFLANIFAKDWSKSLGVVGNIINAWWVTVSGVFDGVKKILNGIIDFIKNVFSGNWKGAWESVKKIFEGVFSTLGTIAKAPINAVIGVLNGLIDGLNFIVRSINSISFEIPWWVPGIGGKRVGFNLGEIGKIAYLAQGGILTSGTAIVGEQGPEMLSMVGGRAVVQPLTNNTTNNQNYGGVTLNIYGAPGQNIQELAEIIMDEMGAATRRQEAVFG